MRANRCMLITVFSAILVFFLTWQTAIAGPPEKLGNPGVPGLLAEIAELNAQIAELETMIEEYEEFAPVPQTGQTICYDTGGNSVQCAGTGQDGEYQYGTPWPEPRFTDNLDGTVTDNITGLIWLKSANCGGKKVWDDALTFANSLYDGWTGDGSGGDCGLSDDSLAGDWRLPNVRELHSLIHYGYRNPALPNTAGTGQWTDGDPFTGVQSGYYWSSTTYPVSADFAWYVGVSYGHVLSNPKDYYHYVWPVRGGN